LPGTDQPVGIGKKAVVTDAVKSVGQHVDQEATDELVGVERHQLVAGVAVGPVILPFEGNALAVEGDERMGGASGNFSGSKRPDREHMNLDPCPYMRSASFMFLSGFITQASFPRRPSCSANI
jgi:hypothetical protein